MPLVDVMDDTFVRAPRTAVLTATAPHWTEWLPALTLRVAEDRGEKGVRWLVTGCDRGRLTGTAEVWLEAVRGGTVVHLYVRLDPVVDEVPGGGALAGAGEVTATPSVRRDRRRLPDRVRRTWKRGLHTSKDRIENAVTEAGSTG